MKTLVVSGSTVIILLCVTPAKACIRPHIDLPAVLEACRSFLLPGYLFIEGRHREPVSACKSLLNGLNRHAQGSIWFSLKKYLLYMTSQSIIILRVQSREQGRLPF